MDKGLLIEYLRLAREYWVKQLKDDAKGLIHSIEDDQRNFLKKYSKNTIIKRSTFESTLQILNNTEKSLKELEECKEEDIYNSLALLDRITFQLIQIEIFPNRDIAHIILAVPNCRQPFLNAMEEGRRHLVEIELEEVTEISKEEEAQAKELLLTLSKKVIKKKMKEYINFT